MTNLFKKQQKQSPLAAVALLSVLLGAQVGAFAFSDPGGPGSGGMPPSYNFGFNSGVDAYILFPSDKLAQDSFIVGRCTGHYTSHTDINECEYGASQA